MFVLICLLFIYLFKARLKALRRNGLEIQRWKPIQVQVELFSGQRWKPFQGEEEVFSGLGGKGFGVGRKRFHG